MARVWSNGHDVAFPDTLIRLVTFTVQLYPVLSHVSLKFDYVNPLESILINN